VLIRCVRCWRIGNSNVGINFLNEIDGELFRDEVQRPWIIRLKGVDVLSRLHPSFALLAAPERARWRWL
jgi:hypothetical protein